MTVDIVDFFLVVAKVVEFPDVVFIEMNEFVGLSTYSKMRLYIVFVREFIIMVVDAIAVCFVFLSF